MKKLLLLALLLPAVQAQLFVPEHGITYRLGESDYLVEETINFENLGSPNLFKDTIYFDRGNAREVSVEIIEDTISSSYEVITDAKTTIRLNLVLWKGDRKKLIMKYRRSDMLRERDAIKVFEDFTLGKNPWITNGAQIRFVAPADYQFGASQPKGTKTREGDREILSYSPNAFENLSEIQDGFPVRLEYARFKDLAIAELARAKALVSEASYSLQDANSSIENARYYEANLSAALSAYGSSLADMQRCSEQVKLAELLFGAQYREYYESRNRAMLASECAREAARKAAEARNLANFEVQKALERRIAKIGTNFMQQSEQVEKNLSAKIAELEAEKQQSWWRSSAALVLLSVALAVALIAVARASRRRGDSVASAARVSRRSSVEDYRVIDDLKRKSFEGFEKKVGAVKKGVEIAAEMRALQHEREKHRLSIEALRKKRFANEISEISFELEKHKFEEKIKELDAKIEALQKELKEAKEIKQ